MKQKSLEENLLIEVLKTFELSRPTRVVIAPLFMIPDGFKQQELMVSVETPCKKRTRQICQVMRIRFRLKDGTHLYRLQINFPTATKETLPIGSKIFSNSELLLNLQVDPSRVIL